MVRSFLKSLWQASDEMGQVSAEHGSKNKEHLSEIGIGTIKFKFRPRPEEAEEYEEDGFRNRG